jgi:selenide,water dikinase
LPPIEDPNLLVGINTGDDAAVYRLTDDIALVQTVDFFPPVVDDPYDYGAVAVANSLSDVYAMGGHPLIALNIVGFPAGLDKDILGRILRGGADKAKEAGVLIVGGHTVDDPEPKYGLSVTGVVSPNHYVRNIGAEPGDKLILTKPLGAGVLTTAHKNGALDKQALATVVQVMATLNAAAAEAMNEVGAHACTDVTGFGLLGHMKNMLEFSGVGARLRLKDIPVIPQAWDAIAKGFVPGGTGRNRMWIEESVQWRPEISEAGRIVLMDAQTSGGLLIAVSPDKESALHAALKARAVQGHTIGAITPERVLAVEP